MASAKERNVLLKSCKESLEASAFEAALAAAKSVAEGDASSYQGWAFGGKAAMGMQDYAQSEKMYKKAYALDSSKMPALQGLAELYEATENAAESVAILKPLVEKLREAEKPGPARKRLEQRAVACGAISNFSEEALCWGQLCVDYAEAPGADLPAAYHSWILALEKHQEQALSVALEAKLAGDDGSSSPNKFKRVEIEVAVAKEVCEVSSLDEAFGRMGAAGIVPSPELQQKYIQRLELRRSFIPADDAATNAGCRDAIVGCCISLLQAEPTNLYAMRTALEILEEDGVAMPPPLEKLWQRFAFYYPMKCDGWVGLADWLGPERSNSVASLLVKSEGSRSVRRYFAQCAASQRAAGLKPGGTFAASKGFLQKGCKYTSNPQHTIDCQGCLSNRLLVFSDDCIEVRRLRAGARLSESRQGLQLERAAALAASDMHVEALAEYSELLAATPPPAGNVTARGFIQTSMTLGLEAAVRFCFDLNEDFSK